MGFSVIGLDGLSRAVSVAGYIHEPALNACCLSLRIIVARRTCCCCRRCHCSGRRWIIRVLLSVLETEKPILSHEYYEQEKNLL